MIELFLTTSDTYVSPAAFIGDQHITSGIYQLIPASMFQLIKASILRSKTISDFQVLIMKVLQTKKLIIQFMIRVINTLQIFVYLIFIRHIINYINY